MEESKKYVIGVEISVKRTTYAIVDVRGNIIASESFVTSDYNEANAFVTALSEKVLMLAERTVGYENIRSMGVSAPSANFLTGSIENAANLPWKGIIPMAALLRDRLGIAVGVANDAHVTALGEHAYGCAHGLKNFILIAMGHGIGSCIFSDGAVHLGADGFAGEIGHVTVVHNGRECGCGRRGCLEAYCAHKGIVKTAKDMMAQSDEPSLMRQLDDLTPKTIVECCEKGDKMAIEVFQRVGHILGIFVASYANLIAPEAIIFTGGIAKVGHWLFDKVQEEFDVHAYRNIRGNVKFMRSSIDDKERDVLGASALAWGIKEYSLFK